MYGSGNWSRLIFETYDCFENQIDSEDVVFQELDWNRINPATGPVYLMVQNLVIY